MKKAILFIILALALIGLSGHAEPENPFVAPEGWNWYDLLDDYEAALPGGMRSCTCGSTANYHTRHFHDEAYQYSFALHSWHGYTDQQLWEIDIYLSYGREMPEHLQNIVWKMEDVLRLHESESCRLVELPLPKEVDPSLKNAKLFRMETLNEKGEAISADCVLFWEAKSFEGTHALSFSGASFEEPYGTLFLTALQSIRWIR